MDNDRHHFYDGIYLEAPLGSNSFVFRICVNSGVQYVRTIRHKKRLRKGN